MSQLARLQRNASTTLPPPITCPEHIEGPNTYAAPLELPWDDWQDEMRGVVGVVVNRLRCFQQFGVGAEWLAAIRISIEAREVAARDLHPDLMARAKEIRRHP